MADFKCDDSLKLLADYQAGSLDGARRDAVEAHLAACRSCRQELAALERTASVLGETKGLAPSRDLWPGVAAQLQPRRAARPWWRTLIPEQRPWAVAAAVATLLVLIVAGSVLLPPASGPPESARLVTQADEDAPVYARWHAEASLTSGMADPYALAFAVSRQTARLEEATAP